MVQEVLQLNGDCARAPDRLPLRVQEELHKAARAVEGITRDGEGTNRRDRESRDNRDEDEHKEELDQRESARSTKARRAGESGG